MPQKKPVKKTVPHKPKTQPQPKSTGKPPFVIGDTKHYNLILHRYRKSENINAVWGVIYEYDTKKIISHTIERLDMIHRADRPTIKAGLHPITPGGNKWPRSSTWHKGPSRVVAEAANGRFGYGSKMGQPWTMMRIDSYNGCLFHPGRDKSYSDGCVLVGEEAGPTGVRPSWVSGDLYADKIMTSKNINVTYYKMFVNSVIQNLAKGKSPQIFVVEKFNNKPQDIA